MNKILGISKALWKWLKKAKKKIKEDPDHLLPISLILQFIALGLFIVGDTSPACIFQICGSIILWYCVTA